MERITKTDCLVLTRYFTDAQLSIMEYLAAGCQVTGINDDLYLITRLITVQKKIEEIREKR